MSPLSTPLRSAGPASIVPSSLVLVVSVVLVALATACGAAPETYFATLPPGVDLPDDDRCRALVEATAAPETHPANSEANRTIEDPPVIIDGADPTWNGALAPRISGAFRGTTEQVLRWGACKWGFDEDITRARAVTESSWSMATAGDRTEAVEECGLLDLDPPCALSYGLLQVKGSVHLGTYPASTRASAFGVDYAMAWLRACYEGSFTWLDDQGYEAGDEWGCVGAWFSGEWYDAGARSYIDEVRGHLRARTWEGYRVTVE